jgi:hypothetical protein
VNYEDELKKEEAEIRKCAGRKKTVI